MTNLTTVQFEEIVDIRKNGRLLEVYGEIAHRNGYDPLDNPVIAALYDDKPLHEHKWPAEYIRAHVEMLIGGEYEISDGGPLVRAALTLLGVTFTEDNDGGITIEETRDVQK